MALKKRNGYGKDNNANANMLPRNEKQQHICIKQKILLMFLIISISIVSVLMSSNLSYSADPSSIQKTINKNDTFNGYTLNDKEQAIFKAMLLEDYYVWTNNLGKSSFGEIWGPMEKDIAALNKIAATADQIQNDYDGNEMAGDRKYSGKSLFFSGVVESINRGTGKNYYISLVGGNNKSIHPQAHMAEGYEEYLASLKKGEMVDLVCQGRGMLKGVAIVDQCIPRYDWIYDWMQKKENNFSKLMNEIPISENQKKLGAIHIIAIAATLPELSSCYVAGSNIFKKCVIEINSASKNKIDESIYKDAARKLKINYAELKEIMAKEKQKVTSNGDKHTSGKSETAEDWYEKAMALWDDNGVQYSDPSKAIEYLSNAIKLKPDYAGAYINRGLAYNNLKQYQRAIEDYNKAIRIEPDSPKGYNNRGYTYLKQGNSKLGCSDARKACEFGNCQVLEWAKSTTACPRDNQDYAMDYFNMGLAHQNAQNIREAIESYTEAIRLNPNFAAPYYNRGGIYTLKGLTQRAIEDFSKVISIKPNVAMSYEARGSIYLEQGNYKLGCPDAKKACELGNCGILKNAKSKGQCP